MGSASALRTSSQRLLAFPLEQLQSFSAVPFVLEYPVALGCPVVLGCPFVDCCLFSVCQSDDTELPSFNPPLPHLNSLHAQQPSQLGVACPSASSLTKETKDEQALRHSLDDSGNPRDCS